MTTGRPTRGSSHSTTDEKPHAGWFVEHNDTGIVTSTTTESVSQSTPTGAQDSDGGYRSRKARRLVRVETHLDGARPDGARYAITSESTARRCVSVSTVGAQSAHPGAPDRGPSLATGGRERE